ncbi:hypothetical protein ACFV23_36825, partial [Streptomyces sp. NPDC059627]
MSEAPLHLVPVRSRQAKEFVGTWHRHHPPPARQIFAVGAADVQQTVRGAGARVADGAGDGAVDQRGGDLRGG